MKQTSLSTANQAGGVAGFIVVIVLWILSNHGIQVPDAVVVAITGIATSITHYVTLLLPKSAPGGTPDFLLPGATK